MTPTEIARRAGFSRMRPFLDDSWRSFVHSACKPLHLRALSMLQGDNLRSTQLQLYEYNSIRYHSPVVSQCVACVAVARFPAGQGRSCTLAKDRPRIVGRSFVTTGADYRCDSCLRMACKSRGNTWARRSRCVASARRRSDTGFDLPSHPATHDCR